MTDIAPTAPANLAWPDHFAVAHMPGSLPMGGVVPMTPIFAFREPAPRLALPRDHGLTPQRTDIELGGLIAFLLVIGRAFAVKNFGHKEATSAIVVSYYWHFVDVVWIGLFLVIYVLR